MNSARVLLTGPEWFGDLLSFCRRALVELGMDVKVLPTNTAPWLDRSRELTRKATRIPVAGSSLGWRLRRREGRRLSEEVNRLFAQDLTDFQPDVIISILCWGDPITAEALERTRGAYRIGWLMDNPFQHNGHLASLLRSYDALYSVEDSWVASTRLIAGRDVEVLPCGADFASYRPLDLNDVVTVDRQSIAFIGTSYAGQPTGLLRSNLLEAVSDLGLYVYGDRGWLGQAKWMQRCYRSGQLTSEEVNKVHNQSGIVLNIHHPQFSDGVSLRTFAICASQSFQLVDWKTNLDKYFDPDVELVTYKTAGELREKALYYLENESKRKQIARAGFERVRREHSYTHRISQMLSRAGFLDVSATQSTEGEKSVYSEASR